jgi:hypothetical protein
MRVQMSRSQRNRPSRRASSDGRRRPGAADHGQQGPVVGANSMRWHAAVYASPRRPAGVQSQAPHRQQPFRAIMSVAGRLHCSPQMRTPDTLRSRATPAVRKGHSRHAGRFPNSVAAVSTPQALSLSARACNSLVKLMNFVQARHRNRAGPQQSATPNQYQCPLHASE